MIVDLHAHSAVLGASYGTQTVLSDFHFNPAVGCIHACSYCGIGHILSKSQASAFAAAGIFDGEKEHGNYLFIRPLNEAALLTSLERADAWAWDHFNRPGIVLYSSTTDSYMQFPEAITEQVSTAQEFYDRVIDRSLALLLLKTGLRVRILTRSPYAQRHFELFRAFGNRMLFGMSLPTVNDSLSKRYEPLAPSPTERLRTLQAAKSAGLNVYVAMSPTYPECDEKDLRATLTAIAELDPVTIFHEPINVRGNNLERLPVAARMAMADWKAYALGQFGMVYRIAGELGISEHLHFLPDDSLESVDKGWFDYWRNRRPAWPGGAVS